MDVSREMLARMIDHTLLTTDATPAQVSALVAEARELGTFSVCVSPSMLPPDRRPGVAEGGDGVRIPVRQSHPHDQGRRSGRNRRG